MKNRYPVIRGAALLVTLGLMVQACTEKNIPLSPITSHVAFNPTPTPAISGGVSEINWYGAALTRSDAFGSVSNSADIYLSVNDSAETTAQVILTGATSPITLPYNSSAVIGSHPYARYTMVGGAFVYQPGATYTLSTLTSVGTAWASVTAPGDILDAPNGSSSRWNVEGTNDRVYVETSNYSGTYNSLNTQADLESIFTIPLTAYPSPGVYYVRTTCATMVNSVNNAMAGSSLMASDELWETISR